MKSKILTFSSHGDTTLLEYDPETADMEEINRVIAEYEAKLNRPLAAVHSRDGETLWRQQFYL